MISLCVCECACVEGGGAHHIRELIVLPVDIDFLASIDREIIEDIVDRKEEAH